MAGRAKTGEGTRSDSWPIPPHARHAAPSAHTAPFSFLPIRILPAFSDLGWAPCAPQCLATSGPPRALGRLSVRKVKKKKKVFPQVLSLQWGIETGSVSGSPAAWRGATSPCRPSRTGGKVEVRGEGSGRFVMLSSAEQADDGPSLTHHCSGEGRY